MQCRRCREIERERDDVDRADDVPRMVSAETFREGGGRWIDLLATGVESSHGHYSTCFDDGYAVPRAKVTDRTFLFYLRSKNERDFVRLATVNAAPNRSFRFILGMRNSTFEAQQETFA